MAETNENKVLKLDATTSDWEEAMIVELSAKHKVAEDAVLDIGITFLINELRAAANGQSSILNSIRNSGFDASEVQTNA